MRKLRLLGHSSFAISQVVVPSPSSVTMSLRHSRAERKPLFNFFNTDSKNRPHTQFQSQDSQQQPLASLRMGSPESNNNDRLLMNCRLAYLGQTEIPAVEHQLGGHVAA
jgi:hypothetical protein